MITDRSMLFLGGAPKCGTSAFFDLLAKSGVFVPSTPKETFYFMDESHPLINGKTNYWKDGLEGFTQFVKSNAEQDILLEGSTHLMYQRQIVQELKKLNTRFVFIIREPASRIRSSFEYTKNNLAAFNKELSFTEYVNILLEGRTSELDKYMSPSVSRAVLKTELELSDYLLHLQFWYQHIPKDNIRIILYENLKSTAVEEAHQVIQWMGGEALNNDLELERKNATRGIRNKTFHRILTPLNKALPQGKIKQLAKQVYFSVQGKQASKGEDFSEGLSKLKAYFADKNQRLADQLNMDLSVWK